MRHRPHFHGITGAALPGWLRHCRTKLSMRNPISRSPLTSLYTCGLSVVHKLRFQALPLTCSMCGTGYTSGMAWQPRGGIAIQVQDDRKFLLSKDLTRL